MENSELIEKSSENNDAGKIPHFEERLKPRFDNLFAPVIVTAVLSGIIGGVVGSYFFGAGEGVAQLRNGTLERTRVVDEESAVVEVVEKSRQAIVSIV